MKIKVVVPQQEFLIDVPDPVVPVPAPTPVPTPTPTPAPTGRRKFSPTSFYNKKLDANAAIHANSDGMVGELVRQTKVNAAAGIPYLPGINSGNGYSTGIYIVKDPATPRVPVIMVQGGKEATWFPFFNEWKTKGIRIPENALVAGGTDGTLCIWDQVDDIEYDFWQLKKVNGVWNCSYGGQISDVSNATGIMPTINGVKTGSTATSLALLGGCILWSELKAGVIGHALGLAIPQGSSKYVYPAQRTDGGVQFWDGVNSLPAGTRFRFPADIVINPAWCPMIKMMVEAVRDFGCVIQDRAGAVVFYAEDTRQFTGKDEITAFYGGKYAYQIMSEQFPFDKLKVLA